MAEKREDVIEEEEEIEVMPAEVRLELIRLRHEVLQAEGRL